MIAQRIFSRASRAFLIALLASPLAAAQGLEDLEKRLADSDERTRRAAVEELSRRNGAAAMALVLKSLKDPSPMVADEAQLSLASADEEAEYDLLFSKEGLGARDELVRLRCAEALGRIEGKIPAARLVKALSDRDPNVRRALVHSIERLSGRFGIVEGPADSLRKDLSNLAERDSSSGVRAASVIALDALGSGLGAVELGRLAADKLFEVRSAALLAAADVEPIARLELARLCMKDAHPSVRLQATILLGTLAHRDAALLLAEALETEKGLRQAWAIVSQLRRLSGLKAARDARYWQRWAKELPLDWKPAATDGKPGDSEPNTATFAGLPLLSERLTILIDLSGSMWEERDGKTRKAGAEKELERALGTLAPGAEFNLIPFTGTPLPWQDALQAATPKNIAAALNFFGKRSDRGKGNFWDALQLALSDPNLDTVVMLGDGAPTGGTRWNVELMRLLFAEQNRFRLVQLDAVLVDCPKGLTRTWTTWCESTGGKTLATDLR